jgi:hypothetical protein
MQNPMTFRRMGLETGLGGTVGEPVFRGLIQAERHVPITIMAAKIHIMTLGNPNSNMKAVERTI